MKQSLARILSPLAAGDLLASTHCIKLNPRQLLPVVSSSSPLLSACRLFSSETSAKPSESNLDQSHTKPGVPDSETISNAELKKQIEKLYDGDEEAFTSVFEAILRRKLDGKSDELDEELINELPSKSRAYNSEDDQESDSD